MPRGEAGAAPARGSPVWPEGVAGTAAPPPPQRRCAAPRCAVQAAGAEQGQPSPPELLPPRSPPAARLPPLTGLNKIKKILTCGCFPAEERRCLRPGQRAAARCPPQRGRRQLVPARPGIPPGPGPRSAFASLCGGNREALAGVGDRGADRRWRPRPGIASTAGSGRKVEIAKGSWRSAGSLVCREAGGGGSRGGGWNPRLALLPAKLISDSQKKRGGKKYSLNLSSKVSSFC